MIPLADADAAIVAWVDDARFVGIGESQHGSGGLAEVRNDLTELLIARADVRAVAIEAPYVQARAAAQAWLERCEGPPGPAARAFVHPAFTDVASAELLVGLCAHNAAHPDAPVRVLGFDNQDTGGVGELAGVTGVAADVILAACPVSGLPESGLPACDAFLDGLSAEGRWAEVVRDAYRAWVHVRADAPDRFQLRDDAMAALLLAQADADVPTGRIVVWAHAAHLAKTPIARCLDLPGRPCRRTGVAGAGTRLAATGEYRVLAVAAPTFELWRRDGRSERWSPPRRAFERHVADVPALVPLDAPVTGIVGDLRARLDEAFDAVVVIDGGRPLVSMLDVGRLARGQALSWRTTAPDGAEAVARALRADGWVGGPAWFTRDDARVALGVRRDGRWTVVTVGAP